MGHSVLIGGTSYEIACGRTLISGTGYDVTGGRTLVGGTGYDVGFAVDPFIDFEYTVSGGKYTLTAWKGTYMGKASTECVIPDDPNIIL